MASKPWTIASLRQHLPQVIGKAARAPQRVYRRNKLVAAVVSPELADEAEQRHRPGLAARFAELSQLCAEEHYQLTVPPRRNRGSAKR